MSKVNEITSASQLQRMLSANKAVIVDFYATWYVPIDATSDRDLN